MRSARIQHRPPTRRRRLDAQTQETERRFRDDRGRHPERRLHGDRRQRRRHNVPDEHAYRPRAQRPCGLHVLQLTQLQHLTADQSRIAHPTNHDERHDDVGEAGTEHGDERDRQQNARKRQQHVHQAPEDLVDPSAGIPGNRAHGNPNRRRHRHDGEPDEQRHARPDNEPSQHVPSKFVDPERVLP